MRLVMACNRIKVTNEMCNRINENQLATINEEIEENLSIVIENVTEATDEVMSKHSYLAKMKKLNSLSCKLTRYSKKWNFEKLALFIGISINGIIIVIGLLIGIGLWITIV